MQIAAVVLSLLLAVAMAGSGVMKLLRAPQMIENMRAVHVTVPQMVVLGVLEVAATVGLVVGLVWRPLGVAAAIGAVVYFAGAVVAHLRASERNLVPAAVLLLLAVAATVGLVVGLAWRPLGVAAAIGAVVYFAGAVVAHLRASERNLVPAAVLLLLAVATLVVLLLAH